MKKIRGCDSIFLKICVMSFNTLIAFDFPSYIIYRHQMKTVADYDAKPRRNPPTKPLVMTMFCFTNSVVCKGKKNSYKMILQRIMQHVNTAVRVLA